MSQVETMNEGMTSAIDEDDERIADEDYQGHEFVGGDIQNDQQSCQGEFVTSSGQPIRMKITSLKWMKMLRVVMI
ncbi:hypothetical protein Dimus_000863, partial [Dionaea muscipula]